MNLLLMLTDDGARRILEFIAASSLRATLILLVAFMLTRLWRGGSAALRHWVWMLALIGVLILPFVSIISPVWRLSVLPGSGGTGVTKILAGPPLLGSQTVSPSIAKTSRMNVSVAAPANSPGVSTSTTPTITLDPNGIPSMPPLQSAPIAIPWAALLVLVWAVGVLLTLSRWVRQWRAIQQITPVSYTHLTLPTILRV